MLLLQEKRKAPTSEAPRQKQRFKLVGLESNRDFNFFAGSEYPSMAPQVCANERALAI